MNEYQKAFKKIDDFLWGKDEPHWQELSSASEKIQELVERATPKKPTHITYNTHGGLSMGKCPVCGRLVVAHNACPTNECRQALDWGND